MLNIFLVPLSATVSAQACFSTAIFFTTHQKKMAPQKKPSESLSTAAGRDNSSTLKKQKTSDAASPSAPEVAPIQKPATTSSKNSVPLLIVRAPPPRATCGDEHFDPVWVWDGDGHFDLGWVWDQARERMFLDDSFYYRSFPDDGNDAGGDDDGGGDGDDDDAETDLGGFTSTGTLIMDSLMHVGKDAGTLSEPGHRPQGAFSAGGSSSEAYKMHEFDRLGGSEVQGPASLTRPQGSDF